MQRPQAPAPPSSRSTGSRFLPVLAAAAAICLVLPAVVLLLQRMPLRSQQPLSPETPKAVAEAVRIPGATYLTTAAAYNVHRLELATPDVSRLLAHSEIHLLVATYGTAPRLERAELRFGGTGCVYATRTNAIFPNNDLLVFTRGRRCTPLTGTPTGEVELIVRLSNTAELAVWTHHHDPADSPEPRLLYAEALPNNAATGARVVRGRLVETYTRSRFRRVDLLAYVWNVAERPGWIWLAIAAAALLAFAGWFAFWGDRPRHGSAPSGVVHGAGAAAIAAALGVLYTVLVPPLQAADEPNHFAGFAAFIERPGMDVEAARLSGRGHFERIQFHPEEKFGPLDVGAPGWAMLDDGGNPTAAVRGSGVHVLWRAVAPWVAHLPAPRLLLALRLINVAIFAITVGLFVTLALALADVPRAHLLAFPLLLVPTIPFFAMHVSNHALLLCTYAVFGLGVLVWVLDGRRSWAAGALVGVGWALSVLVSRSAVPLAPLALAVLAGRMLLGERGGSRRSAPAFWGGAALGGIVLLTLAAAEYLDSLTALIASAGIAAAAEALTWLRTSPWLLAVLAAAAAGVELGFAALRRRVEARMRPAAVWFALVTPGVMASAVIVLLGASLVVQYPVLDVVNAAHPPEPLQYVRQTLAAALTMFRLTEPDMLTSWSFWGGFGWIDTLPDWRFVAALVTATAAALVTLLALVRRERDARATALLILGFCGFAASIAAYAISVVTVTPADVHGRYLLGAYLSVLLVCWSPLGQLPVRWTWAPALGCAAVHAYCLTVVLRRYF